MPKPDFFNHHNLDLLKVALPYMNPRIQKSVEVLTKADEFVSTMQSPGPSSELSTMSISSNPPDLEEILLQLKPVSNKKEQDLIDNMSNVLKMQKMLQSYRSFTRAAQASGSDNTSGSSNSVFSQDMMTQFLLSQLSPEQKSNFENINVVLNSMNN